MIPPIRNELLISFVSLLELYLFLQTSGLVSFLLEPFILEGLLFPLKPTSKCARFCPPVEIGHHFGGLGPIQHRKGVVGFHVRDAPEMGAPRDHSVHLGPAVFRDLPPSQGSGCRNKLLNLYQFWAQQREPKGPPPKKKTQQTSNQRKSQDKASNK